MRALSADGRCVLAQATASTPAAGDGNERLDVFVLDLQEGRRGGSAPPRFSVSPRLAWPVLWWASSAGCPS